MRNAVARALAAIGTAALFAAAQPASAQQTNGCPAGQAMQSSDASGRNVTCVAIPNVSGLQGQISTETAARMAADNAEATTRGGMDAMLLQGLQQETADRKAADDALRNAVTESSIVGTYAFSGTITCLSSNNGFNADFSPKAPTSPTVSTQIQQFGGAATGTRTFNADGTGTVQSMTYTVFLPTIFYTTSNFVGIGFNGTPPNPGGGASTAAQNGSFTWEIVDGKLYITEDTVSGSFTQGSRVGWTVENSGMPRAVGVLGKDLRTIATTNEILKVETGKQTSPDALTVSTSDRICVRDRVLRKL
jgi:hypothetical protein